MSKELIERVQNALYEAYDADGIATEAMARAATLAVLEHYSDPENVTENMALELFMMFPDTVFGSDCNKAIANVMRAARDEVSRG